jgi:hypothetical protein
VPKPIASRSFAFIISPMLLKLDETISPIRCHRRAKSCRTRVRAERRDAEWHSSFVVDDRMLSDPPTAGYFFAGGAAGGGVGGGSGFGIRSVHVKPKTKTRPSGRAFAENSFSY